MDTIIRVSGILRHSLVNGPGVRYVVFTQGCPHNCKGCQNPETHDINAGSEARTQDIISEISSDKYLDGVTLSGGDPFLQPLASKEIADAARGSGLSVWAYTGWRYEELTGAEKAGIAPPDGVKELLESIDVLVDGRYVDELHVGEDEAKDCMWRGSSNQRLIDVKKSMAEGRAVLYED